MKNIARDIFFRCKHDRFSFKFCSKLKGPPFYYQNFLDPEIATSLLSFACSKHIYKCKYMIFVKLNNISLWKRFLTSFAKNWKGRHFMANGRRSLKLSGKVTCLWKLSEIGTLLLKLVWAIGTFSFDLLLIRVTYLRISKTKSKIYGP